ncbi:hypothetical protein [Mycolicibacterium agri]|nr:hypothetical protein [Mycolicibacterium agri]
MVKHAISTPRAKGTIDRTNYTTATTIEILDGQQQGLNANCAALP